MDAKTIARRKLEKNFSSGKLTAAEYDEALKNGGLEAFDPDMTQEEYVMKCGSPLRKYSLIDMKGQAARWNNNEVMFAQARWDKQDKKLAEYFADKYSADNRVAGGLKVPDHVQAYGGTADDGGERCHDREIPWRYLFQAEALCGRKI